MTIVAEDDPRTILGAKLRDARLSAGLSQAQLAESIGCGQAYVSRAERGLENPPLMTCVALFAALGRSFNFFIT